MYKQMIKGSNKTQWELEDERIAKEFYMKIIDTIKEFLKITKTSIAELCVYINIDPSTFYRYESGETHIDTYRCKQVGTFFKHMMEEKHIPYTQKIRDMVKDLVIFEID